MKRIISLTKVMMKSSVDELINVNVKKGKKKTGYYVLFGFLFLYLAAIVGFFSYFLIDLLYQFGQEGFALQILFSGLSLYIVFTTIFVTPTVFYFAKDIEHYLVMPIKPSEILIAKILTSLVSVYAAVLMITIPFGVCYFIITNASVLFILYYILANIFLPLFPAVFAMLLIIVIFTFIPFFRNKDLFTYISMFFAIAFGLSIGILSSSFESVDTSNVLDFLKNLQNGNNSIISTVNLVFPTGNLLARGIVNYDFVSLTLGAALSIASVAFTVFITQFIYFKGVIGIGETGASKRKMSHSETYSRSTKKSQLSALIEYDLRNILRTPLFMMNYFFSALILPVFFIAPMFFTGGFSSLSLIIPEVKELLGYFTTKEMLVGSASIGFFIGIGFATLSTVTSTAISREGRTMLSYKTMPFEMKTLIQAKIALATIVLATIPTIIIAVLGITLRFNILYILIAILFIWIATLAESSMSIVSDVFAPKLDWVSEQQAVKNNFMSVVPMFVMFAIIGISVALVMRLGLMIAAPLLMIVIIALGIGSYLVAIRLSKDHLSHKIEAI
ncbi:hypothetical protein G7059_06170 [Erysipelothrix sp. HDW6A]|uniref:putative ABC transporter permease subunit n=1 Tax=Erysipelothrix sp. HDW6A TaxID=2714928 RepID=UPI00140D6081|nr:hypothetical protein [Erysipelothrix sp. HDW6A]QIK57454.1 hypothetical protein G7059_06170 [Erysipelothrix sp. HDW6A]